MITVVSHLKLFIAELFYRQYVSSIELILMYLCLCQKIDSDFFSIIDTRFAIIFFGNCLFIPENTPHNKSDDKTHHIVLFTIDDDSRQKKRKKTPKMLVNEIVNKFERNFVRIVFNFFVKKAYCNTPVPHNHIAFAARLLLDFFLSIFAETKRDDIRYF